MCSIIVVVLLTPCYIRINDQCLIHQIRNLINVQFITQFNSSITQIIHVINLIFQMLNGFNLIIQMLNVLHHIIQTLNVLHLIIQLINHNNINQSRTSFNVINTIIQMINDDQIILMHQSIHNASINKFKLFLFSLLQIT